jgi:hypothetical protein
MVKQVSFSSKKPARIIESRKSGRTQAHATGKIICQGNGPAFNCTIQDISPTGASIHLSESQAVPKRFFLVELQSRVIYDAEVVWVAYAQRGLHFVECYDGNNRLPPHLEHVKRQAFSAHG